MELMFAVENHSSYTFSSYSFYVDVEGTILEVGNWATNLKPHSEVVVTKSFSELGSSESLYRKLENRDVEDIDYTYHTKELSEDGEAVVKNIGIVKVILLLVVSLIAGIVVLQDRITIQWLRMVLKVLMIPSILLLLLVGPCLPAIVVKPAKTHKPHPPKAERKERRRSTNGKHTLKPVPWSQGINETPLMRRHKWIRPWQI